MKIPMELLDKLSKQLSELTAESKKTWEEISALESLIKDPNKFKEKAKKSVAETIENLGIGIDRKLQQLEWEAEDLKKRVTRWIESTENSNETISDQARDAAKEVLAETEKVLNDIKKKIPTLDQIKETVKTTTTSGWGWVTDQRDSVWNWKSWKKEPWTNTARAAGFWLTGVGLWAGIYIWVSKGWKALKSRWSGLWWDKEEENEEETSNPDIWEEDTDDWIREAIEKGLPKGKKIPESITGRAWLIAFAKKKGITPAA